MITKGGRDLPIESITADNYIVPKGEEKAYHAIIEVRQHDPKTGKRISQPRIQKFGKKMFESHVRASLLKQGYTVTILHDPNEWIKAQAAKAEQKAKEQAEAKAQAEKEKFDAAVDKAVSERVDAAVQAAVAKALAEAKKQVEDKKPGRPTKEEAEAKKQAEDKAGAEAEPEK